MIFTKTDFKWSRGLGVLSVLGLGLTSCSSLSNKTYSSGELFEAACSGRYSSAKKTEKVSGSVWAKIDSPELSGQFPATVMAQSSGDLALEVTNLIGSPQAWIKIRNQKIEMKLTPENQKSWGGSAKQLNLGGLPLEFAPALFLGRSPCPSLIQSGGLRMSVIGRDLEVIEKDLKGRQVRYLYEFDSYEGRPWVSQVNFQGFSRSGQELKVEFQFESPQSPDRAAKRWSASSSRGKIDVRWKDRASEISEAN